MVPVMVISVVLIAMLCVLAYTLAVYALPFMLGLTAAQFACQSGSGLIGASLVGFVAAVADASAFNAVGVPVIDPWKAGH